MKYLSLFSGIGGFECGILQAFPKAECLGFSEINPRAIKVYKQHFPDHTELGDITELDGTPFKGKVDLLVGGSPCQDFSVCGDRKGLDGDKSSLFYQYVRILKECQPKYFILENVNMSRKHRDQISEILEVEPVLINSSIASHQNRKRLYWTNFDIAELGERANMEGDLDDVLFKKKDARLKDLVWRNLTNPQNELDKKCLTIKNGGRAKRVLTMNRDDELSPTLTGNCGHTTYIFESRDARQLHPIEAERLMTFPDDWTKCLAKSYRFERLGNAVSPAVIREIVNLIV